MNNSEFGELRNSVGTSLTSVQRLQRLYDDVGWQVENPPWAKLSHILLHLSKINAGVANLVEPVEHALHDGNDVTEADFLASVGEQRRLAAELVFHAAQIANLGDFDLGEELLAMYHKNAQRFAPQSMFVVSQ